MFEGIELQTKFSVISIRNLFSPKEIRFFPDTLKEIEGYSTKLSEVVNFLLRANQLTVSRIFENKKMISPDGIYSVWLMSPGGVYQPICINDEFAFDENENSMYAGLV